MGEMALMLDLAKRVNNLESWLLENDWMQDEQGVWTYVGMATPPSSPATAPTEATQPGSSTGSVMCFLAREDLSGGLPITATVTFPEGSSPAIRGRVLRSLQDVGWMPLNPETSASLSPSGVTPQTQPSSGDAGAQEAGE